MNVFRPICPTEWNRGKWVDLDIRRGKVRLRLLNVAATLDTACGVGLGRDLPLDVLG